MIPIVELWDVYVNAERMTIDAVPLEEAVEIAFNLRRDHLTDGANVFVDNTSGTCRLTIGDTSE